MRRCGHRAPPARSTAPAGRSSSGHWSGEHLDTAAGRRILDVTDLGIHSVPLDTLRLGGRVTTVEPTYVQTWHGSAFKRMGFDEPRVKCGALAEHRRLREMVGRFDGFVVRSEHDVRTLVSYFPGTRRA